MNYVCPLKFSRQHWLAAEDPDTFNIGNAHDRHGHALVMLIFSKGSMSVLMV